MQKNILWRVIAVFLAVVFVFDFINLGAKGVQAAVGPAIFTLALIVGSVAGYAGLEAGPETFKGMSDTLPPKTLKGPHFTEGGTYWCENTSGEKFVWDKRKGKWLPKKDWENLYNHGREITCQRLK